jgi:class 3 adenylate cyclase
VNADADRGSGEAGITVAPWCVACGTQLRLGAKFCDQCGSAIAAGAEYKQVTVLFADVVHSMDIAAAVGAERLREIMTELVNRAVAVVHRYGGTVDKFTGDGIMAVFGAPAALEDHALRACLAALGIQDEANRLAVQVQRPDGVDLRLRIGLNSGQVIAGEIGSGALGYTAFGEQVGIAQRMESAAPPCGVMLSASTARLVEGAAALGESELVEIKGAGEPVAVRKLLGLAAQPLRRGVTDASLVGRDAELAVLTAALNRAMAGQGCVVGVTGPAGIGKTRLTDEMCRLARSRGVEVVSTFCESHAADVPFLVVARLLRAVGHLSGLDDPTARQRVRTQFPHAEPQDLLLLDDLLGIADPDVQLPEIDSDARRRRLIALLKAGLASNHPAIIVVEDVHWIDKASESMLADFLAVTPDTRWLVLITYRPEYRGSLARLVGADAIALPPLSDTETSTLVAELLGPDPSVGKLGEIIAERAAGNPFFALEMTRELAERNVLQGRRGGYACHTDAAEVRVPATLQATITARIDRLAPLAKQILSAAAVIGARFSPDLLASLGVEAAAEQIGAAVEELVIAQLIDQVRFTPHARYAFRHPLIRTVAYESQLKADRARLHRRLAAAIEARGPDLAEPNAALIAEHLEAAGDLLAAYGWHMRAATWATNRDIAAARQSWERAQQIADTLPADTPRRTAMRIAPRTMLCGIAWRVHVNISDAYFEELRQLCTAAADKPSLAIAMAGLVMDRAYQDRTHEASQLASEAMALIESIGDPTLTVGLSFMAIYAKMESADWPEVLRWSQRVIDLADDDPAKGNLIVGSPLAGALSSRAIARCCMGRPGWQGDLQQALAMGRNADPLSHARVIAYVYLVAIPCGALRPDDAAMREIEAALRLAERSGDDLAVALARMTLGLALVHRRTANERDRGDELLAEVRDVFVRRGHNLGELAFVNVFSARERARRGDHDGAIPLMRTAVDHLVCHGQLLGWGIMSTGVLVETLLDRGTESDLAEAEAAIQRLAAPPPDDFPVRDIWVLRLYALLARARGEQPTYRELVDRYQSMAKSLDYQGHITWAEAMA